MTINEPLPKQHYELRLTSQRDYVGVLIEHIQHLTDWVGAMQPILQTAGAELKSTIQLMILTSPEKVKNKAHNIEKFVKVSRAKIELLETTEKQQTAAKFYGDLQWNYENFFLPGYEKSIEAAVAKWTETKAAIDAVPEVKKLIDKELDDAKWNINDGEVKLQVTRRADILLKQLNFDKGEKVVSSES